MKRSRFIKAVLSPALLFFLLISGTAFYGQEQEVVSGVYQPKIMKNMAVAKKTLSWILNNKCGFGNGHNLYFQVNIEGHKTMTNGFAHYEYPEGRVYYSKALVLDDRIELSVNMIDGNVHKETMAIYFSELFDSTEILDFRVFQYHKSGITMHYATIGSIRAGFEEISFHHHFNKKNDFECFKRLADALLTIKKDYGALVKQKDSLFKVLAQKYRAMKVKPVMSEEQRKYVVQANYYTNHKKYPQAINLYRRVIKLNPTYYPTAYNNLALLYAQVNHFTLAIFYMRHFLLLEPNGKEARAAQDKIYEWELKVKPLQ